MTRRRDFLAANAGRRAAMPGFVLLAHPRGDGDPAMRIGFTVTKKIGNAVTRNRLKRRLRALARELLPVQGVRGADHVLIGRGDGVERDFTAMRAELVKALRKVAGRPSPSEEESGMGRPPTRRARIERPTPTPPLTGEG